MNNLITQDNIFEALNDLRKSQTEVDNAKSLNKTDPIAEEKVKKLNKSFDEIEEEKSRAEFEHIQNIRKAYVTKKLSTTSKFNGTDNHSDDFFRCKDGISKVFYKTKSLPLFNQQNEQLLYNFADIVASAVENKSIIRKLANSITISDNDFECSLYANPIITNWSVDGTSVANAPTTSNENFIYKRIQTFDLTAQPRVTNRIIADAQIDIQSYILNIIVANFSLQEDTAFINGDGITMPKGILNYPAISTAGSVSIARVSSKDPNNATITIAGIFGLYYALSDLYTSNASFLMHKSAAYVIRTMKDPVTNQYIWMPGVLGNSDTLLGRPFYTSAAMPQPATIPVGGTGNDVVIFGDFASAYQIVDRGDLLVQIDPYTSKPYTIFFTTKRVGGDVIRPDALKIMRIGNF